MKRWSLVLLLFMLLLSACSGNEKPNETESTQPPETSQEAINPTPGTETPENTPPENIPPENTPSEDPQAEPAGQVPTSEKVSTDWFSDAAFVGDSVSVMLDNYNSNTGHLGTPSFFCSVSLSQNNALTYDTGNKRLPEYPKGSGQHPKIEDGIAAVGAKKVYIMLGMNCIAGGVDRAAADLVKLAGKILEKSPDAAILVESVTPMTADSKRSDDTLNNQTIAAFNAKMQTVCVENGWYFVNVAEAVSDENGYLRADFSGDAAMGIHFNYSGAEAWADYLLTHVPEALK